MYDIEITILIAGNFGLFVICIVLFSMLYDVKKKLFEMHRLIFLPQTSTQKPPSNVNIGKSFQSKKKKPKFFTDEQMWEKMQNDKRRDDGNRYYSD